MFEKIFREIQAELNTKADEEYRILVRDHFKMDVSNFLGVRIPLVRKIANKYFKELKGLRIEDILKFCNQLLETKIYEHKVIAFHWSFKCSNQYQNEHFKVFESWLKPMLMIGVIVMISVLIHLDILSISTLSLYPK